MKHAHTIAMLALAIVGCDEPADAPDGGPADDAAMPIDAAPVLDAPLPSDAWTPSDAPDAWSRADAGPDIGPLGCAMPAIPEPDPAVPEVLAWDVVIDLTERADHHVSACAPSADARDAAIAFVAPSAGRLTVETIDSDLDTVLSLRAECDEPSTEVACSDDAGRKGGPARVVHDVAAGEALAILVEARGPGASVSVRLTLVPLRAAGDACDAAGLLDACAGGATCATDAGGASTCVTADGLGCPPGRSAVDLTPHLSGRSVRYAGRFEGLADREVALGCGPESAAAPEAVHRLVMPFRGMIDAIAFGRLVTTMYVRTQCDDATTEVVCAPRGGFEALSSPVFDAGTELFVFVEPSAGEGSDYTLAIDLDRIVADTEPCATFGLGIDRCESASICRDEGGSARVCRPVLCGDGWVERDEQCDATPGIASDGCSDTCMRDDSCAAPIDLATFGTMEGGALVYRGSNVGAADRQKGGCTPASVVGGGDLLFTYVAPSSGTLRATTVDPTGTFDTVLYVRSACGAVDLACNDDAPDGMLRSTVTLPVTAGQPLLLVVDGYSAASRGNFVLRVSIE